jgi:hypothetical protein
MVLPIDPEMTRIILIIANRKETSTFKEPIMLILRMLIFLAYGQGSNSWQGQDFSLLQSVQTDSGAHAASYSMGMGVLSLGVNQPGCEADQWSDSWLHPS